MKPSKIKSRVLLQEPLEHRALTLLCDRDTNVHRDSIIGKTLDTSHSTMRHRNIAYLIPYINVPPTSLYDVIEDQIKAANKKDLLHRMVLVTDIDVTKRRRLGAQYEELFRQIESRFQSEPVTGILLLYPKNCIHVIETSMKNLNETVKVFQRQADKRTVLTKCKILLVAKNIQRRLFPWWHYAVVSLEDENLGLYQIGENPYQQINEMLLQIIHLGLFLGTLGKSTKEVLQNLSLAVPRYLPEQGLVYHLLETSQTYVSLPGVFLKKFKQPYDVQFTSDTVWPHESYALPVTYRMKVEKPRRVPIPQSSQLCLSPIPSKFSFISPRQLIFPVRKLSITK